MSHTVWKYEWEIPSDRFTVQMPKGAEILCAREQFNKICIWARVKPQKEKETRKFVLTGTGHEAPEPDTARYIGSAQLDGGAFVFHVFELLK